MNNNETPSDAKCDFRGQPQEIIMILWLLHESIANISSLGSLNSLICLFVALFSITVFVFSCPFFPLFLLLRELCVTSISSYKKKAFKVHLEERF